MSEPAEPRNRAERRAAARRGRRVAALGSGAVLAVGAAGGIATLLSAAPASAADPIVVTSLTDDGTGTTLREAIEQANAAAGQDTITFQTGLSGTITVASALPKITDALDIQGPGAGVVTVDGSDQFALFNFYNITAAQGFDAISGLTVTHGVANNGDNSGGGIVVGDNSANITISNMVIDDNTAPNDGGGVEFFSSSGTATITGSTISNNTAEGGGGGLYATSDAGDLDVVIENTTFSGNHADGDGGGIYLFDVDASISGSTISGNSAGFAGGGIWAEESEVTITGSTISGNTADNGGGGLYLHGSSTDIEFTTISGNTAGDSGGGGLKAEEYAGEGGDITTSTLLVRNSTVSGNTAQYYGGGLYIRLAGQATLQNSTVANNTAKQAGGIYGGYAGMLLDQVTISGNSATDPDNGIAVGGIQLSGLEIVGSVAARHPAANAAPPKQPGERTGGTVASGGVGAAAVGTVDSSGALIAGNTGQDVGVFDGAVTLNSNHDVLGTVDPAITVNDQGGTQQGVTNPGLGPLQNNGGATETMALLAGSPAINTGPVPVASFPGNEFDQRGTGFARVVDGVVDVGAYEVQPPPEPAPAPLVITPRFTG
jgi:parallel beta-helix repeat protein/predicted outer membrane repeat protein